MAPQALPYRAWFKHINGAFNPELFGRRLPSGTRTSSRIKSEVTEARSESLFLISGAWNPDILVSTINPRISPSALAQMIATSDIVPFVIQRFVPLSTQPLFVRRARVSRPAVA